MTERTNHTLSGYCFGFGIALAAIGAYEFYINESSLIATIMISAAIITAAIACVTRKLELIATQIYTFIRLENRDIFENNQ